MATRLPAILVFLTSLGLAPTVALAAECGDVPLTQAQQDYLAAQSGVEVNVPEGDVPVIQRCDIDGNNSVDIMDIRAIAAKRNQPSAHPDDPMDWDRNNVINVLDARGCQLACALPRCAIMPEAPPELVGGTTEEAECSQTDDFDGDGEPDVVAVSEYAGTEPRGGDWALEVVILTTDDSGNVQHATFPYSGKKSPTTGEVRQHVSKQPAGVIDLNPGTITIDEPAVVSYEDDEPKVIYYYVDGELARAFYGVDD